MKQISNLFLAVLLAISAIALSSCSTKEITWEDNNKNKTEKTETVFITLSKNNYVADSYSSTSYGHRFVFHDPQPVPELIKDYPQGVSELTIPLSAVKKVEESEDRYMVYFTSSASAGVRRFTDFRTNLPASKDTTLYKGAPMEIKFDVLASNGSTPELSYQGEGAEVKSGITSSGGKITVTPTADCGRLELTVSVGGHGNTMTLTFDTYYLHLTDIPESFGDGDEFTFSMGIETNLHEKEVQGLSVICDSWMTATISDDGKTVTVKLDGNGTESDRTGNICIRTESGLLQSEKVEIWQSAPLYVAPGTVPFKDRNFKNAVLPEADANDDGEVSLEEASAVKKLHISGKGVRDLSGLECFTRLEKLDAQDNDIRNADVLKNLEYLYWLDLKGNMKLRSFDVTGCSMYFEHCEFECTEQLEYRCIRRQVGITALQYYDENGDTYMKGSDPECEHSIHIIDERTTADWSRQNRIVQLATHTKGNGKNKLVFTGLGYIDRDLETGTFERIMKEAYACVKEYNGFKEIMDYLDVYIIERVCERHNQWVFSRKVWRDEYGYDRDYAMKYFNKWNNEKAEILRQSFANTTTGRTDDWQWEGSEYNVFVFDINIHPDIGFEIGLTLKEDMDMPHYDNKKCWYLDFNISSGGSYTSDHIPIAGGNLDDNLITPGSEGTREEIEKNYIYSTHVKAAYEEMKIVDITYGENSPVYLYIKNFIDYVKK